VRVQHKSASMAILGSSMSCTREPITRRSLAIHGRPSRAVAYRLRFKTPDPLSLINCTVWLAPFTTMWITPEIEYSRCKNCPSICCCRLGVP